MTGTTDSYSNTPAQYDPEQTHGTYEAPATEAHIDTSSQFTDSSPQSQDLNSNDGFLWTGWVNQVLKNRSVRELSEKVYQRIRSLRKR